MHVWAGILLLLVALFNSCTGLSLVRYGVSVESNAEALEQTLSELEAEARMGGDAGQLAQHQEVRAVVTEVEAAGPQRVMALGIFLLLLFAAQIAGSIAALKQRHPKLVALVALLSLSGLAADHWIGLSRLSITNWLVPLGGPAGAGYVLIFVAAGAALLAARQGYRRSHRVENGE